MTAGYKATMDELQASASKFTSEGNSLDGIAGGLPKRGPSTGEGSLDAVLTAALAATQFLGEAVATQVKSHGSKLKAAHDTYQQADAGNKKLFTDLMK